MPDQPNLPSDQVLSSLHEKLKAHTTPELAARATELVDALLGLAPSGGEADVPEHYPGSDLKRLNQWYLGFSNRLMQYSEQAGRPELMRFRHAFPPAFTDNFSGQQALDDIRFLESLKKDRSVCIGFYQAQSTEYAPDHLAFKLYSNGHQPVLSDVIPVFENLGLKVLSEHPHRIVAANHQTFWISDVRVQSDLLSDTGLSSDVTRLLEETFARVWEGAAESDRFNRLVVAAGLNWREVTLLRACARYMKQLKFGFSQNFLADVLARNLDITRTLVTLFHTRFDPEQDYSDEQEKAFLQRLASLLEDVVSLDDDRILRRYVQIITSIVRTNAYQNPDNGESEGFKPYWSFKLCPGHIADMPSPVPAYEVFVYSPDLEGVHLRAGKVARGGLRWSDRQEDYRTEVLGLVKAQQVKNSVIVPVGAKGCFVCKRMPDNASRDEVHAEGLRCYRMFIRGLLDVTDNMVNGAVVHPAQTRCHDDDDVYLVVAADKGTATFSDVANRIAEEYDFWLGDAFASGGSEGYDHKGMGITARGAWESVRRHFRERNIHVESDPVSVIGIGDMSGDVFGNGLLLSRSLHLVAAFNHTHIVIDPTPDASVSWAERQRLFELPRSSWADYRAECLSAGGGIFSRTAKWIRISPEMQARFGIETSRLSPGDLIHALLQVKVDLIWNGGIGTWVKGTAERHATVGDKANDLLRVDAGQLKASVIGEGGNLGITQAARVEFALAGGSCNTDFIDNAGGVDCSDHEVNIKILLNEVMSRGDVSLDQRNRLLRDMTEDVSRLVLKNNYRQAQAISLAEHQSLSSLDDSLSLMQDLTERGVLIPAAENLPNMQVMAVRREEGTGFTRPELSVLICYARLELKEALSSRWVTDQPEFQDEMDSAFPAQLRDEFGDALSEHRLRREIIATQMANDLVNRAGMTLAHQIEQQTGADPSQVAAAWLLVRRIFNLDRYWLGIEALDGQLDWVLQAEMMNSIMVLVERAIPWILRHFPGGMPNVSSNGVEPGVIDGFIDRYQACLTGVLERAESLEALIPGSRWQKDYTRWREAGTPEDVALFCAAGESLYWLLDVIDIGTESGHTIESSAGVYFGLGSQLNLTWLDQQLRRFDSTGHWQRLAVRGYRRELDDRLRHISLKLLNAGAVSDADPGSGSSVGALVLAGASSPLSDQALHRWNRTLADIQGSARHDCAAFSVALDVLGDLAF